MTRHTSIRYSSFSHTRVNMGQHGHYTHAHHLAAEMWTTMKNDLLGKKFLSCSFYLYKFHKYVSYGFPITNFCNPTVHYEMPCKIYSWIIYTFLFCKELFWINIYTEWTNACCKQKLGGIIFVCKTVCWITALSMGRKILIGLITSDLSFQHFVHMHIW
jgi:hypothetical protein